VLIPIDSPAELAPYVDQPLLADFEPQRLVTEGVDSHWLLVDDGVAARCSLWWRESPRTAEGVLGTIGHFAARDAAAAEALLAHACRQLGARGCVRAVGPMDGSTWRRYRFVVERGDAPPFVLEPDNPDIYPHYWRAAGFAPLAHYYSALQNDLTLEPFPLDRLLGRLRAGGIRIRPLRLEDIEGELRGVYRATRRSFARAFLYTPIDEGAYLRIYRPLLPLLRPELCLIAEREGSPGVVGYLFALADAPQARRGERMDTLVIKTVAALPEVAPRGLGSALVGSLMRRAHGLGYHRAVHALMHESNASLRISRSYRARPLRRYALFAREL
jgi:GNAT superfamily N-acetyltransferase